MSEFDDAKWAHRALLDLHRSVDTLLGMRTSGAGKAVIIAALAALKDELKTANRSGSYQGKKMPIEGPGRFLASAIQRASADFRMRSDTDPSKVVWSATLNELKAYFSDYSGRIRKECPEVE
jgi:hypothetical protein